MKLLLTAFLPFGGETQNAALEAVSRLPARIGTVALCRLTLPVSFSGCCGPVLAAIERERPDAILCVGQAAGRTALTPERRAVNRMDARIPDNDGAQPRGVPIVPGGPEFLNSTLPVERMVQAMCGAGVPAEGSNDAGRYVCNRLLYGVLYALSQRGLTIPAGFLHVPRFTGQEGCTGKTLLAEKTASTGQDAATGSDAPTAPEAVQQAVTLPLPVICTGLTAAIEALAALPCHNAEQA